MIWLDLLVAIEVGFGFSIAFWPVPT